MADAPTFGRYAEIPYDKMSPEQQQNYLDAAPEMFEPATGAWGRGGATMVRLNVAKKTIVKKALETAWAQVREGKKRKS